MSAAPLARWAVAAFTRGPGQWGLVTEAPSGAESLSDHGRVGAGRNLGGRTKTQGVSLTNQAQQLAPPEEMRPTYRLNRRWLWGILVLVVASLLSSISVILGIAVLLGFAVWLFSWRHSQSEKAKAYNRDVLPGLLARWNRSWFCRRCGCIFEATANSAF